MVHLYSISRVFLIFIVVSCIRTLVAQEASAQPAIAEFIHQFSEAAVNGQPLRQYFSPQLQESQQKDIQELSTKSFRRFSIVDFRPNDIELDDPTHARVKVTVEWETSTENASRTATLHFVNIGGKWYFANAGFWKLHVIWFTPFIAYGLAYGIGVVIMMWHLRTVQWANFRKRFFWEVLSVIPGTLPLYFARRPWMIS
jgi:uncharacterized protein YchJ